jgi:hypothetical protein
MSVVVGTCAVATILLLALVVLIARLTTATKVRGVDPEWLRGFTVSSYGPMERLLNEDDLEFIKSHPGYEQGLERKLRRRRIEVFRMYLSDLKRDFGRLHYALRLLALHAPQDDPELAKTLIRQRLAFQFGLTTVKFRLLLYGVGIGRVEVGRLVDMLDAMQLELRNLAAVPAPA